MLTTKLVAKLNHQINLEFFSSNLYLQMSSWCDVNGLDGAAAFLRDHSDEERDHGRRLFDYVNQAGGMALIGTVAAPPAEFESVQDLFAQVLDHERMITREINDLVDLAFAEKDFSLFNFLQWYVAEQHEEEHLFQSLLDRIKLVGTQEGSLFLIDREIERLSAVKVAQSPA